MSRMLADWIRNGPPDGQSGLRRLLLTPHASLRYSGMVPGWLAGQHGRDEGLVDIAALAARAGVEWVAGRCTALDPEARLVRTDRGETLAFDFASLDTGGVGRAGAVLGHDPRLIDIRRSMPSPNTSPRVPPRTGWWWRGGGAGGVELAFGLRNLAWAGTRPDVALATGAGGLLPGFSEAVRRRAAAALVRQGIGLHPAEARLADGAIKAGGRFLEPADLIVAALGSAAPDWVRASGLAVDDAGFVLVDRHQRFVLASAYPRCRGRRRPCRPAARPIRGSMRYSPGPVLAANLRKALAGQPPRQSYHPRWNSLYLMNTGDGQAIAAMARLRHRGAGCCVLKHWIDKRLDCEIRGAGGNGVTSGALSSKTGQGVPLKKIIILAALAAIVAAYFLFRSRRVFTLDGIKAGRCAVGGLLCREPGGRSGGLLRNLRRGDRGLHSGRRGS